MESWNKIYNYISKKLSAVQSESVSIDFKGGVIFLTGDVSTLEDRLDIGFRAAKAKKKYGLEGVVNDITVDGKSSAPMGLPDIKDNLLEGKSFDVVIIGGGVIGVATARELSRWNLSIAIVEKEEDLGLHASSRNDGMIHPGMAAKPGSLKAKYNVRGNELYTRASEELDFVLKRPGSLFLFKRPSMRFLIPILKRRCHQNGVSGGRWVNRKTLAEWEPALTKKQHGGFFLPSAGIVSPQDVVLAFGENAASNGVEFFFHTVVKGFQMDKKRISRVETNRGTLSAGIVINTAGVWADKIAEYANDRFFSIHPRKGVDAILDKRKGNALNHIMGMPSLIGRKNSHSKGGGLVPCVEGNILVGPTAEEVLDREDYSTHKHELDGLRRHIMLDSLLDTGDIITYYAGTRAATWEEDFIIQGSKKIENLVHGAGIQSPGFASAPAIAEDLASIAVNLMGEKVELWKDFNPIRKAAPLLSELSEKERLKWIEKDPAYGRIVCRCEQVSEGEIRDSLKGHLPATSVDGVKRRTRAGAGRCHGGFCLPRVMEIMAREKGIPLDEIRKSGNGSWILQDREDAAI